MVHFNKAFLCIIEQSDQREFERFFEQVLKQSSNIIDTVSDLKTDGQLRVEKVLFNTLVLAHYKKKKDMTFHIVRVFLEQNLLDPRILKDD